MATKKTAWAKFPHDQKAFDYAGDKLKKAWPALHEGDGEPYPDDKRAAGLLKTAGKAAPKGLVAAALASDLEHRAAFRRRDQLRQLPLGGERHDGKRHAASLTDKRGLDRTAAVSRQQILPLVSMVCGSDRNRRSMQRNGA